MLIFVYEYTCAQPSQSALPASLRAEGGAMLAALLADFAQCPGVTALTLVADGFTQQLPGVVEHTHGQESERFMNLAGQADYTLVIAPEIDDILALRCRWLEQAGGRSLNCTEEATRLTADKLALAQHFAERRLPTPATVAAPWDAGARCWQPSAVVSYPAVLKPRWGAGSLATFVLREASDLTACAAQALAENVARDAVLQAYAPGQAASVAFVLGPKLSVPLLPAAQQLSTDGRCRYEGGWLPLLEPWRSRAAALAERAVASVPGLRGYVGVDLVLGEATDGRDDVLIELNPRLTTSYLGLRQLAEGNLAYALLRTAQGYAVKLSWLPGTLRFDPAGAIQRVTS